MRTRNEYQEAFRKTGFEAVVVYLADEGAVDEQRFPPLFLLAAVEKPERLWEKLPDPKILLAIAERMAPGQLVDLAMLELTERFASIWTGGRLMAITKCLRQRLMAGESGVACHQCIVWELERVTGLSRFAMQSAERPHPIMQGLPVFEGCATEAWQIAAHTVLEVLSLRVDARFAGNESKARKCGAEWLQLLSSCVAARYCAVDGVAVERAVPLALRVIALALRVQLPFSALTAQPVTFGNQSGMEA
jgi:hypothetical protein